MVIYLLTNLINGKQYVGQTIQQLRFRIYDHKLKKKFYIGQAIDKYGLENFKIEILEECSTKEQLDERERYWIAKLNTKAPNGYNLTNGGEGVCGRRLSAETVKKILTNEPQRREIRCLKTGEIFLSVGSAARHFGISRAAIRRSCQGKTITPRCGFKFEFVDSPLSEESKQKSRKTRAKPVRCIETGEIFPSAMIASKIKNISNDRVGAACRGVTKSAGGYHWEFVDEQRPAKVLTIQDLLPRERAVRCVETGEHFKSIKLAGIIKNISCANIGEVCRGNRKTAGGYHWEYLT